MEKYDHKQIEKKWQAEWEKSGVYRADESADGSAEPCLDTRLGRGIERPKQYVLDMFPYPSGEGLHVGHPKGYIATDVYSRMKRMQGYNVLHVMGWDAFGLPAEQYAIKNKVHPRAAVERNVVRYKDQLLSMGLDYDWSREINTTDPEFYKWTQWIFIRMFEKGLAYESFEPINWCPTCQTGLANEDLEGAVCERCDTVVEKKPMRQWVLRITDYADRMLVDLEKVDWPESIKESQRNWIGRSEGAEINFKIKGSREVITVFTTRPDTLFGATYCVLAPEHALLVELKEHISNWDEVAKYCEDTKTRTEIERTAEGREKTGVRLHGVSVINPANDGELPVFVADYVLGHYGTGAVMAVPAHDERDFDFAKKYELPVVEVVQGGDVSTSVFIGSGALVNSGKFDGEKNEEVKKKITDFVKGRWVTKYRLKDWVFSRQRYWGEPIPIIHCEECGVVAVPEKDLPLKLPQVDSYTPTGTGESPLALIDEWVNTVCPKCGGPGKRETDTMPNWAGSSWYYLRFIDPHNDRTLVDREKEKYWSPVDMYVGGAEHATRHLIYARFYHKFLYDIGVVNYEEPFMRLQNVGLIIAEDGRKMSKRWGNVVNPDDIVAQYGADTLRLYEMFMGPFRQSVAWSTESIIGPRRFLERVWRMKEKLGEVGDMGAGEVVLQNSIKKVGDDIESFGFNTAISTLMILVNEMEKLEVVPRSAYETLLKLLAPFAPHLTEELWSEMGNKGSIHLSLWPTYDPAKCVASEATIVVQVDGKMRGQVVVPADADEGVVKGIALANPSVSKWIIGKSIKRMIFVPRKLLNIVLEEV